ncbi:MAG TPA: phosphoglycerate kinase [Thermoanaerobaculia bacterium]|nr:phosphoglycerate kinase [Thermoanaerobaculia bacterium]
MIEIPTVDRLNLLESRVFYRVDYNVPLDGRRIADATRIEATIPTLLMLRERGAAIVIASHFGRPKGKRTENDSLAPVRARLADLIGADVGFAEDCIGDEAKRMAAELKPGGMLLLENLRFHEGEEKNDEAFARALRELADFYVNDAFGACHRAHASIDALPRLFPPGRKAGGLLLMRELNFLQKITSSPERPFVALLGGAKIAGKIEPLEALAKLADTVLIGGGMANTFLLSRGHELGSSLVDKDSLEVATRILNAGDGAKVVLPRDLVVTDSIDAPTRVDTARVEEGIGDDSRAVDIGPETIAEFAAILKDAKTIFWNGPMGVFERPEFAAGTMAMAQAVAESEGLSIIGGGESVEAVKSSGFAERISHISTGGGASLEFIAGAELPGITVLEEAMHGAGD